MSGTLRSVDGGSAVRLTVFRSLDFHHRPTDSLRTRARAELGAELPDGYLRFLGMTNGMSSNGLVVYAFATGLLVGHADRVLEGLVEANLAWRDHPGHDRFVFFAEGETSRYAFDQGTSEYQILDHQTDTLIDVVGSFDHLLLAALESHRPHSSPRAN